MKTIRLNKQVLLVDETAEIKEGDYFHSPATKKILYASKDMLSWNCDTTQQHKGWTKIIAASPKLEGIPEFETLPPNTEDDVEKLATQRAIDRKWNPNSLETRRVANEIIKSFIAGYNQAKSETMFSLEDMNYIYNLLTYDDLDEDEKIESAKEHIQSLTKPKEYEFVVEMEYRVKSGTVEEHKQGKAGYEYYEPKIVNNKIQEDEHN